MEKNRNLLLIDQAVEGNVAALEELLLQIQDDVFHLSLRMLGMVADAEDAAQDIMIKVMTNLSSFQKQSRFETWVYRIAVNYLISYKKNMFSKHPLNFEFYGHDIAHGAVESKDCDLYGYDEHQLEEELKMSCTNVMLQCLDAQSRCIFVLGTMFKVDSKTAAEILDITPENYRQKLSRARKKMGAFLSEYCGLSGTGMCSCKARIPYAIAQHRLQPEHLEYAGLKVMDHSLLKEIREEMEKLDDLTLVFEELPAYGSKQNIKEFVQKLTATSSMAAVMHAPSR